MHVNIVNIGVPEIIAVIILKFEQGVRFCNTIVHPKDLEEMANGVDPDQTAPIDRIFGVPVTVSVKTRTVSNCFLPGSSVEQIRRVFGGN